MKKAQITKNLTFLPTQSTAKYELWKDEQTKLYYIYRNKDNKIALVGDSDASYDFILYGIEANKEELLTLFPARS